MKTKKRISMRLLSSLLCVVMLLGILPMQSFAASFKESQWYLNKQLEDTMPEMEKEKVSLVVSEIPEKRTESEKHFRLEDGTSAAAVYDYPVHYDVNGQFEEIDNSLSLVTVDENSEVYENKNSPINVQIAKNSNAENLVTLENSKGKLSWNLVKNQSRSALTDASEFEVILPKESRSVVDKGQLEGMAVENVVSQGIYEDIQSDVDLQYVIKSNVVKENIILKSKNTPNSFSFEMKHDGLSLRLEEDGSVTFYNTENVDEVVFVFAAPFATDAKGEITQDVQFTIEIGDGVSTLTVTANEEWLQSDDRSYPVVIDPYTKPEAKSSNIMDTFVRSSYPNSGIVGSYGSFLVGKNYSDGTCRALVKFNNLPQLNNGDIIYDAYLDMVQYKFSTNDDKPFNIGAYEPFSEWREGSTTWNNQPATDGNAVDYVTVDDSLAYRRLNITKLVRQWYNTGVNNGVMLKSMAENKHSEARFFTSDYPFNEPGNAQGGPEHYPTGVFCYKNATGIEDYWNYHQQSAGTAGTGYVNDFNGNLAFFHDDASTSDPLMAAAASHVYNLSESNQSSRFGYGWNLNVLQSFVPTSGVFATDFPFVYTDGDGTKHYFYNDNGVYKDEDGLGMVYSAINEGELTRKITLKDKTVLKFDLWGGIRRVVDTNGNTVSYNHGPTSSGNYIGDMTDSSGNRIHFIYSNDPQLSKLTEIHDEAGRIIRYTYDAWENLKTITYPDGSSSIFHYDGHLLTGAQSSDGRQIVYEYSNDLRVPRVTKITERSDIGQVGQELSISYNNGCTTVFEDGGTDGLLATTGDNDYTTSNFDKFGRMNDTYDKQTNAVSEEYYSNEDGNNKNKISSESKMNKTSENLLRNGRVESHRNDNWFGKEYDQGLPFGVWTFSNGGYDDMSCFVVQKDTTFSTAGVAQEVRNLPGGAYTLSAYVKTEGEVKLSTPNDVGASVMIDVFDSAGTFQYRTTGKGVTNTDRAQENGWVRVSTTAEIPNGGSVIVFGGLHNASGQSYFDNFQFERGSTPGPNNLVSNGGFEQVDGSAPYRWSGDKGTVIGGGKFGSNRLMISSKPDEQSRAFQPVDLKRGKEGDVFTLSGWANGVATDKGTFSIGAAILYDNHDPIWHMLEFDRNITNWQYGSVTFSTDDNNSSTDLTYFAIHLYIFYEYSVNEMSFDGIQLLKDSGQSYVYNDKGDLVSAKAAEDSSKFTYDGNSNLKSMTDVTGTSFNYDYDSKNNLTFASNSDGLKYNFNYDSKGNALGSNISGDGSNRAISSGKSYYVRLQDSGKYMTNLGHIDANQANVGQYEMNYYQDEQWRLESVGDGYYKFVCKNSATGRVLDIRDGGTQEGANLEIYNDIGAPGQKFKLKPAKEGGYYIVSKCSGDEQAVTKPGDSTDNVVNIDMRKRTDDDPNQIWYFEPVDFDTDAPKDGEIFNFRSRLTGQYMNVNAGLTDTDTRLIQYYYLSYPIQQFKLTDAGNGCFFIDPMQAPNMRISEKGVDAAYGKTVMSLQPKDDNDDRQKFSFHKVGHEYAIRCKASAKFLEVALSSYDTAASIWTDTSYGSAPNQLWILEKSNPNSISSTTSYVNGTNKTATQTDARGNVTNYSYTSGNRMLSGVTANGSTTDYTYDPNNDLLTSVSGGNSDDRVTNTYLYDKGKLKTIGHNGFNYNFTYDGFGNPKTTSVGNQTLITNEYNNNLAALTKSTYGNGDFVSYAYDNYGNISRKTTGNGYRNFSYTYDSRMNPLSVKNDVTGETTTFAYDFIDRPLRVEGRDGHKMSITYDDKNRVNSFTNEFDGNKIKSQYIYGDKTAGQAPSLIYGMMVNDKRIVDYSYDNLSRMSSKTLNTTKPFVTEYSFAPGAGTNKTTTLADGIKNGENSLSYTYDSAGNILTISDNGTLKNTYTYDSLNQLKSDVEHSTNLHTDYSYDDGGNITSKSSYTLGESGEKLNQVTTPYAYGDANWKDKLTSFNGEAIFYDEIGNPIYYYDGATLSWGNGRQLSGYTTNTAGGSIGYDYDDSGLRVKKSRGPIGDTKYYYNGTNLVTEVLNDERIDFLYDDASSLLGLIYKGSTYYYIKNLQNDIIGILDKDGNQVVSYTYDSWGKPTGTTGSLANTVGSANPFRYRGYYYDGDTGFYYLNSRYYDPVVGRFLNADGIVGANKDISKYNLFAYCSNNAIVRADSSGYCFYNANGVWSHDNWEYMGGYTRKPEPDSTTDFPNAIISKQHEKKGTTNPSNRNKHEQGQTRKQRDSGGEKGDAYRTPNPNKRRPLNISMRLVYAGVAIAGVATIAYFVANDLTGVGFVDDAAIIPVAKVVWDTATKALA